MTVQTPEQQMRALILRRIVEIVTERAPIGATSLMTEVVSEISAGQHGAFDVSANNVADGFNVILEECVESGDIRELGYIHPETPYKIGRLYFPKDTSFVENP